MLALITVSGPAFADQGAFPAESRTTWAPGEDRSAAALRELEPRRRAGLSMAEALALDLAIPGGGHFYTGNMYTGGAFAALKVLGIWAVYYSFRDWQYRRSLYRAARRANAELDPGHELQFEKPGGGYSTVEDFRRDYDRAAQRTTFSVLGTAAVYAVSLIMTYQSVKKINAESIPSFDLQYSCGILDGKGEMALSLSMTRRF